MVITLAELYPELHFILQMSAEASSPDGQTEIDAIHSQIDVQKRPPGSLQNVKDAALYIVRLPTLSFGLLSRPLSERVLAELRAHLSVLRASPSAKLVLVLSLLPEPGSCNADVEAAARTRDLCHMQLSNQQEMDVEELVNMVNGLQDNVGGLMVVHKLNLRDSATVAFTIQYQFNANGIQRQPQQQHQEQKSASRNSRLEQFGAWI
jgi:hypothetical protein